MRLFKSANRREVLMLFLGDSILFVVAIFCTLLLRYLKLPSFAMVYDHIHAFSFLFLLWFCVFFVTGLYEKHTLLFRQKLFTVIITSQVINIMIAVLFFYLVPEIRIQPRLNLVLYLVFSTIFIVYWRSIAPDLLSFLKKERAILVADGQEASDLFKEVNKNPRYHIEFIQKLSPSEHDAKKLHSELINIVFQNNIQTIIVDIHHPKVKELVPIFYNLIFSRVSFIVMDRVYEEVFDRVPLSVIQYNWFLEHLSKSSSSAYFVFKRMMDIGGSCIILFLTWWIFPLVRIAQWYEDRGQFLYFTTRVGQDNKIIKIPKIRSMNVMDSGKSTLKSEGKVTKVGNFIRKTRIDELPQLWSVLKGDLSLIGPRPEIPELAKVYEEKLPYYNVRHLVKPGLSGWAQIYHDAHPHHGVNEDETRNKLSYDLYYLKNKSLLLDVSIVLKTVTKILTASGK